MTDAWRRALLLASVVTIGLLGAAPAGRAASKVERVVSPGGIEAYLIREPSIPFLSLALHFRGGAALDPAGKEGLAHMASGLLDEGAGDLDSQAFRTELEDRAIRLSFEAGRDEFTGQLKTLTSGARARVRAAGPGAEPSPASMRSRSSGSGNRSRPSCAGAPRIRTTWHRAPGSRPPSPIIPTAGRRRARPRAWPTSRATICGSSSTIGWPRTIWWSASPAT